MPSRSASMRLFIKILPAARPWRGGTDRSRPELRLWPAAVGWPQQTDHAALSITCTQRCGRCCGCRLGRALCRWAAAPVVKWRLFFAMVAACLRRHSPQPPQGDDEAEVAARMRPRAPAAAGQDSSADPADSAPRDSAPAADAAPTGRGARHRQQPRSKTNVWKPEPAAREEPAVAAQDGEVAEAKVCASKRRHDVPELRFG